MSTYEFNVVDETDQYIFVVPRGRKQLPKLVAGDILKLGNQGTSGVHMVLKVYKNPDPQVFKCTRCDGSSSAKGGKCIRPSGSRFCIFVGRELYFKDLTKELEEL